MIKLENISFKYKKDKYILKDINLEFKKGQITMIIGKNGSGKSTICNLIANFLKSSGTITIDNQDIKKIKNKELRKKVGIVFQNPNNQIIFNKVLDDLNFSLTNLDLDNKDTRIKNALDSVDMVNFLNRNPYELSLGEKQRIALANQLAINPDYYILDEITSMIDFKGKKTIYEIIKNLKQENKCIIMTTNIMDELLFADNIIILDQGKIKSIIKKQDLLNKIDEIKEASLEVPFIINLLLLLKEKGFDIGNFEEDKLLKLIKENL